LHVGHAQKERKERKEGKTFFHTKETKGTKTFFIGPGGEAVLKAEGFVSAWQERKDVLHQGNKENEEDDFL
jgi:hypothetical protein